MVKLLACYFGPNKARPCDFEHMYAQYDEFDYIDCFYAHLLSTDVHTYTTMKIHQTLLSLEKSGFSEPERVLVDAWEGGGGGCVTIVEHKTCKFSAFFESILLLKIEAASSIYTPYYQSSDKIQNFGPCSISKIHKYLNNEYEFKSAKIVFRFFIYCCLHQLRTTSF